MSSNINIKTGLFFGSFNPIHIGHLIIAQYFVQHTDITNIWFILSPQNPFKLNKTMLDNQKRFELLKLAIESNDVFEASDIEFFMNQPSYTYKTIELLINKYPEKNFVFILGSDNLAEFKEWEKYEKILEMIEIYVYPRPGFDKNVFFDHPKIHFKQAPVFEISSSFICKQIEQNKDPKYLLPEKVYEEIMKKGYYK